jgi:hypothetical protein
MQGISKPGRSLKSFQRQTNDLMYLQDSTSHTYLLSLYAMARYVLEFVSNHMELADISPWCVIQLFWQDVKTCIPAPKTIVFPPTSRGQPSIAPWIHNKSQIASC